LPVFIGETGKERVMNVTRKFALLLIVVALVGSAFSFAPGASAEAKPEDDKKAEPAPVEDE